MVGYGADSKGTYFKIKMFQGDKFGEKGYLRMSFACGLESTASFPIDWRFNHKIASLLKWFNCYYIT